MKISYEEKDTVWAITACRTFQCPAQYPEKCLQSLHLEDSLQERLPGSSLSANILRPHVHQQDVCTAHTAHVQAAMPAAAGAIPSVAACYGRQHMPHFRKGGQGSEVYLQRLVRRGCSGARRSCHPRDAPCHHCPPGPAAASGAPVSSAPGPARCLYGLPPPAHRVHLLEGGPKLCTFRDEVSPGCSTFLPAEALWPYICPTEIARQ